MARKDVVKVHEAVRQPLAQLGFQKRAGLGIFTLPMADEVGGWLGLNVATQRYPAGVVGVNPIVGVRHGLVQRRVAELRRDDTDKQHAPTISTPIGYLMPENSYEEWDFDTTKPMDATAKELVSAVEQYGVPFMKEHASLEATRRYLEKESGFYTEWDLPVIVALLGEYDRGVQMVESHEATVEGSDEYATLYRAFADRFRRWRPELPASERTDPSH